MLSLLCGLRGEHFPERCDRYCQVEAHHPLHKGEFSPYRGKVLLDLRKMSVEGVHNGLVANAVHRVHYQPDKTGSHCKPDVI